MNNPQFFTFGEIERQFDIGKSTLSKDRKNGKFSADKNPDGSYRVAMSELVRAYGDRLTRRTQEKTPETVDGERLATPTSTLETAVLEARLEGSGREIALLRDRVDDLVAERDAWRAQAERATMILSDQRQAPAAESPPPGWRHRLAQFIAGSR